MLIMSGDEKSTFKAKVESGAREDGSRRAMNLGLFIQG